MTCWWLGRRCKKYFILVLAHRDQTTRSLYMQLTATNVDLAQGSWPINASHKLWRRKKVKKLTESQRLEQLHRNPSETSQVNWWPQPDPFWLHSSSVANFCSQQCLRKPVTDLRLNYTWCYFTWRYFCTNFYPAVLDAAPNNANSDTSVYTASKHRLQRLLKLSVDFYLRCAGLTNGCIFKFK